MAQPRKEKARFSLSLSRHQVECSRWKHLHDATGRHRFSESSRQQRVPFFSLSVCIVVYCGKDHLPVECNYGSKTLMLSLIGYQFDRVIEEERRRLLGVAQGTSILH